MRPWRNDIVTFIGLEIGEFFIRATGVVFWYVLNAERWELFIDYELIHLIALLLAILDTVTI